MKGFFLSALGTLLIGICAAQPYTSKNGWFQVDQIRGCAPFTMTITNSSFGGKICAPCTMYYNGTPGQACPTSGGANNLLTFTYTTPGTYQLCVSYPVVGNDVITVTVDPNTPPPFNIYTCAGDQVSIKITDTFYDLYRIDFNNDGIVDTSIPSSNNQVANFNYGANGNYNINVKGEKLNALNNCSSNIQPFTAIPSLPVPVINSLNAVDAATLQLNYTPQTNILYHADIAFNNASNFQQYQTLYAVNSLNVPSLSLNSSYYCFRMGSYDPCANTNTYTSPICSHNFAIAAISGADQLTWASAPIAASTQIQRGTGTGAPASIATVPGTTMTYQDNSVICKTTYCYKLVSTYAGGATSTSLTQCVNAFLKQTPTAIDNISTSVGIGNTSVDLVWLQDPAYTSVGYNIYRSQNTNSYTLNGSATATLYTDGNYTEGNCYLINYTDNCDNPSAKDAPACPIVLSGNVNEQNDPALQWKSYKGWQQGVKYYSVRKFNSSGQLLQTFNTNDTTFIDSQPDPANQVVLYKIVAISVQNGLSNSLSNEIKIVKGVNLFYPTAFNPESKVASVNRTFTVKGQYISKLALQVFDRWGTLVYYSDQNEPWDGRKEGLNMPDATYVWTAEGTDQAGNTFKQHGTILLLRK
ncbi:MAG: gliding motility-associated C-terminal domain-containing protein [Bacteroidetes bacterium]|nr:gliding motility-associated C-terminal domain-containing protein [Bacteroidota bacterium]MBS1539695.1 gliding motility-associated C-terminal domain-containing protein [Bacteroidota bacterium]